MLDIHTNKGKRFDKSIHRNSPGRFTSVTSYRICFRKGSASTSVARCPNIIKSLLTSFQSRWWNFLPTLTYASLRLIYNMSSFDFQPFLHSPSSSSVPAGGPEPISADQQEKLDELIKKFGDEGYVLEGEKLTGWEMSFLVSS
jgi:hypothetical protein